MRRKSTGKKIKTSTPSCQNWLLQNSKASHRLAVPYGKFSPAHRDNKGEPWCAANPNQSLVQRHLGEVRPPKRSGNRWRWFEVYLILGTSECAKIKTETVPKMGKRGEPIAELTRFGWTLMSPESESHLIKMFLTQTSKVDYEELCWLDSCAWIRGWSRCRPKPNVRRL